MPLMCTPHQLRIVPERSVPSYQARGWTRQDVEATGPPERSDRKDVWVDFAADQGMDRAEAAASTKADLVERFG